MIVLTGEGPLAFCSGGDQQVRGDSGYLASGAAVGRFHVTDLQVQMRRTPKPIVAMIAGYAIGGGHVLHVVCDLSIAADNARFGQTGPRVGSFDGGFGASLLAAQVGQKKAKEIWFLCRQYDARGGAGMGLVNTVVPLEELEEETVRWCREMLELSPFALRLLKASFNAAEDGLAGHPAARPRRQPPLLRERGGAGGAGRLPGEAQARTSASSPSGRERGPGRAAVPRGTLRCGCSRRGRARCRPRWRRCWSAPSLAATEDDLQPAAPSWPR